MLVPTIFSRQLFLWLYLVLVGLPAAALGLGEEDELLEEEHSPRRPSSTQPTPAPHLQLLLAQQLTLLLQVQLEQTGDGFEGLQYVGL